MCLITTQQTPLIAEEDMITYKVLSKHLSPFYYPNNGFKYELGKLNETHIKESDSWMGFCDEDDKWIDTHVGGFSYDSRAKCKTLKSFGQGYHSTTDSQLLKKTIKRYHDDSYHVFVECVIPKGREYYINPINMVVSNKLIIVKVIDL